MVDRNKIRAAFEEMGLELSDEVADKCIELCELYDMDETELFETWMAYSVTSDDSEKPTVEKLSRMERKLLVLDSKKAVNKLTRYNTTPKRSSAFDQDREGSMFVLEYPETSELVHSKTPESNRRDKRSYGDVAHSPGMPFSPFTISPAMLETGKGYLERTNAGQVVCNYDENVDTSTWKTTIFCTTDLKFGDEFYPMNYGVRYMYSTLLDKIQSARRQGDKICLDILKHHAIKLPLEMHHITMESATFAGRVICDSHGKLNSSSVLLESCLFNKRGDNVRLELTGVPEYSLFPGQCIVVEGKNPDGMKIIAEKIYSDAKLTMYPPFRKFHDLKEPLQIVVACGPYMLSNACHKPYEDLMAYAVETKPHALILIGPIVDTNYPNVMGAKFTQNFKDCFRTVIEPLLEALYNTHTKVILVSSWKEACLHIVYPSPPSPVRFEKSYPNLLMAPDPSIINISGFHIGLTSTDIIMHLGKEELFCSITGSGSQRLSRLASHLFQQKCFYPLKPVHEDMSVDPTLLVDYGQIPLKPHVMIVPSDLKSFINVIQDSVFVNPEKLTKGAVGGTFARIQARPAADDEDWSPATHVSAQVVKI